MTNRVEEQFQVNLNGVRYYVPDGVTSSVISQYPENQRIGDITRGSQKNLSYVSWADQRGGIGIERMEPDQTNRAWTSRLNLRHKRHLILPALATQTADATVPATPRISQLGSAVVTAFATKVHDLVSDSWGTAEHTVAATPLDMINGNLAGTEYLVISHTTGYAFSSSISSWSTSTKDASYMAFWHDRFWAIDAAGQLWYTYTLGSEEVNDAKLLLTVNDDPMGLFTARDATGEIILYVVTRYALYAHDVGNRRFIKTAVEIPANLLGGAAEARPGPGGAAISWRDDIYIAANTGLYRYRPGAVATLEPVGFDRDDGLDAPREHVIQCFASSVNELIVGAQDRIGSGKATIYAMDGDGAWQVLYELDTISTINSVYVTAVETEYRLWFGVANDVWHIRLPDSLTNPSQISTFTYEDGFLRHEYPVFDDASPEVTKIAMTVEVECEGMAADSEVVKVFHDINHSGTYTQFISTDTNDSTFDAVNGYIEGNGVTTFSFPSVASPAGSEFRSIQIAVDLDRGGTNTKTPDVVSVTLGYLKVLDDKLGFDFTIEFNDASYSDNSAQAGRAALRTAEKLKTLVEFTYRDDDGGTRNYYCKILGSSGLEETGHIETGSVTLRLEQI